jgi:hypothetical protein
MKTYTYVGVEVELNHSCYGTRWKWLVSSRSGHFTPGKGLPVSSGQETVWDIVGLVAVE